MPFNILISGAANGLGAAFLQAYKQQRRDVKIFAIDYAEIRDTGSNSNIAAFQVDVTSQAAIDRLADTLKSQPLDLVIHSAGIRGLVPAVEAQHPDDVAACETLDVMDSATLVRTFQINAVGTFMLLRALLPNLRMAGAAAKVVVMSSRMGSIDNNVAPNKDAGRAYAYRASKAAGNMMVRSLAVDVPDVTFVLCHPGRVETKLVKCKEEGAITAEESVQGIMLLIEKWSKEDSGKFYDRFGKAIPW